MRSTSRAAPADLIPRCANESGSAPADVLYTRRFFQVFAAVMLFMSGVALQYHFGQYIEFLGLGVDTLGRVLSVSMIGTLLIRLHIGRAIDRFGCRVTWLVGTLVVAATVGSIQFVEQIWLIVLLRSLWAMATAAVMTTVAVLAAQMAAPRRRAEAIGIMGLAGFVGMLVGPTLGDWIFSGATDVVTPYRIFFSASAACSLLSGAVILFLKPGDARPSGDAEREANRMATIVPNVGHTPVEGGPRPSQIRLILGHWPGMVLLTGMVFSMVFCLQSLFLERLADDRGFQNIKVFFLVYAPTAITLRVLFRHVPERFGRSRTIVFGSLLLSCGLYCLIGIDSQWQLVLPGLLMGAGHSFVFPSMVDLAAERFPFEHRGTGTALILGAGDAGLLIGFATLGELIDAFGFDAAIATLAGLILLGAVVFGVARRGDVFHREQRLLRDRHLTRS